jgi:hypothetical protein
VSAFAALKKLCLHVAKAGAIPLRSSFVALSWTITFQPKFMPSFWKEPRLLPTPHLGQAALVELVFHRLQKVLRLGYCMMT